MARTATNKLLTKAKSAKNDEFYTVLSDIERELKHYKKHFKNKVVFCNCDDPRVSNFFHYFSYNFEKLGLKKLITTCYKNQNADLFSDHTAEKAIYLVYEGDKNNNRLPDPEEVGIKQLKGDGDFRSQESIELLKQSDIVVTNPPFAKKLEAEIVKLMQDDDVTNKKGIYTYVLNRKEKHLSIRSFTPNQKREAYERQKGICPVCKDHFEIEEMEADHIKPWHDGGKTISENCQMLCKDDNRTKSGV